MSVISLSATPSDRQLVQGIPQFIYLTANIPSIIFYTLDGTDPTLNSSVYSESIQMPGDHSNITLKALATNGVDYSAILSLTYTTSVKNKRTSYAKVTFLGSDLTYKQLIGGSVSVIKAQFDNNAPGNAVNLANVPDTYLDGYDANGDFGAIKSDSIPGFHDTLLSDSDEIGQTGPGIGELPDNDFIYLPPDPQESYMSSKTFDPRAAVIFADSRIKTDIPVIFKPSYYDVDVLKNRPSAYYETSECDGNRLISGSFVKQFYNSKTNTMTYYYRDSLTNRWIISTESMEGMQGEPMNLGNMCHPLNETGSGVVFRWILFRGTCLI